LGIIDEMPLFQNHVGLSITKTKLQLVEITYKENSFFLENVDEQEFEDKFDLSYKATKLISILQKSFDELNSRRPLKSSNISFSLSNDFFKIVELPYDETLTKEDLLNHLEWELSVLFPESCPHGYLIQHIETDKSNLRNDKRAIVIAGCKNYLGVFHKFCIRNNFNLHFIDNSHIASNAFISINEESVKNKSYLSIYLNKNSFSLIVLDENLPVFFKTVQIDEDKDLAALIDWEVNLIKKTGFDITAFINAYLFGEILPENFADNLEEVLNIPVKRINPFEKLKYNPSVVENEFYTDKFKNFTAPAGIALRLI
jgi:hypothetical protein